MREKMNFDFWKDGYKKRAAIYIALASAGIVYELFFRQPSRTIVLLLWGGVIMIGLFIWTTLKDTRSEK